MYVATLLILYYIIYPIVLYRPIGTCHHLAVRQVSLNNLI